jgi:small subunit ribosomal protein S2
MPVTSLESLLEAGVHFGHQTKRWNPKMKKYIWGEQNGIYIIDLTQTVQLLQNAYEMVLKASAQGKKVVFVGTKKQAADIVEQEATRCGAYYINRRWLGGTLTNFETIRTRINRLRELEEMKTSGHFDRLPKKEVSVLTRELDKLERTLGGVKDLRGMPDILFVIDQKREVNAVLEANKTHIPVIAIVDTNCDPDGIDYVIPGNDDSIRALRLVTASIADAILEGKSQRAAEAEKNMKLKMERQAEAQQAAAAAKDAPVSVSEEAPTTEVPSVEASSNEVEKLPLPAEA